MDVLIRHTLLGECLRYLGSQRLRYSEEHDLASVQKNLIPVQDAELDSNGIADEHNASLASENGHDASRAFVVYWYGEEDEENPANWPPLAKWVVTVVLSVVIVAMYTGSAFWSVCIDDAKAKFHICETVAQLGTSSFVIGFGLGPTLWSPLSEMPSVGRMKVYASTALIFIVCQLPIPLSNNITTVLTCRFLTGFFCSRVLAVGGGTIADMFGPTFIGYPMACWELATWGGSAVGPTFAGFTYDRFGLEGPMWQLVFLALFGLTLILCLLPETSPAAILHQRAQRLRRADPEKTFVTYSELEEGRSSLIASVGPLFAKSVALNFQEPIVFVLNIYAGLVFAIFFGMLESYPYVFKQEPYNFDAGQVGLTFLGIFAGGFVSMIGYFIFLNKHQHHLFDENGNITPEGRLLPAIPGSLFVPLGLFWYGWTTHIHFIMPTLGGFWFGIGMFTIFMAARRVIRSMVFGVIYKVDKSKIVYISSSLANRVENETSRNSVHYPLGPCVVSLWLCSTIYLMPIQPWQPLLWPATV